MSKKERRKARKVKARQLKSKRMIRLEREHNRALRKLARKGLIKPTALQRYNWSV